MRKPVIVAVAALGLTLAARAEDRPAAGRDAAGPPSVQTHDNTLDKPQQSRKDHQDAGKRSTRPRHDAKDAPKQQQAKPCEEIKPCAID